MKKKLNIIIALLVSAIVATLLARCNTQFANAYHDIVYKPVSTLFAFIFGVTKFSVVELLLYAGICYLLFCLGRYCIRKVKHTLPKNKGKERALQMITNLALVFSILFFLYVMNCGINYYCTGFAIKAGYHAKAYTTEEVLKTCTTLTKEINEIQSELIRKENGEIIFGKGNEARARSAMESLGTRYKSLSGYYPLPKPLLNSSFLSYQGVTGIYSPFTVEANYNNDMPEYLNIYVMCHELSHLKGIMREEEANFVAFLACENSEDASTRYSGLMHAYTYCMNELYERDKEQFLALRAQLNQNSDQDIKKKQKFWDKYDTKIAKVSDKINDSYLKANAQSQGVDSYNAVTGYIVEYFQRK